MAIYKKGADPTALRASAERITAHARECDAVRGDAARAVSALRGQWSGGDLDHLMTQWPPIESQLSRFSSDLGRFAEALRRNAGQQDSASTGGVGGSQPSGPPESRPLGGPGEPSGSTGEQGRPLLGGLGLGVAAANLPTLLGQSAGVLSTFSRAEGWLASGRYLSNITQMAKVGDPLFELLPTASRVGGTANLVADMWGMNGLSGLFVEGGAASRFVGRFGVLGPIGVGLSAASAVSNLAQGNYGDAALDGVGTALGMGALLAPPPANLVCGVAGLGLAAYQNIPWVHDTVNAVGSGIADVATDVGGAIGEAASDTWDTVTGWF